MMASQSEVYMVAVDPERKNNPHAYALRLIGSDKRVLELGCGHGHVTAALVAQGNVVIGVDIDPAGAAAAGAFAKEVHVADLDVTDVRDLVDETFDVVLLGDVLEHLRDPWTTLDRVGDMLQPDGIVVVSLPNVAHIDVRLALLRGEWTYRNAGLLDRTHLRFFTIDSVRDLLARAGMKEEEMLRVRRPVFTTELKGPEDAIPRDLLAKILEDPEAETYQFVVKASPEDGATRRAARELRTLERQGAEHRAQAAALGVENAGLRRKVDELETDLSRAVGHNEALEATKLFRYAAPLRNRYRALTERRHGG